MVKVLIITNHQDDHAKIVSDRLRKNGDIPIKWFPDEFLEKQKIVHKVTKTGEHYIKIKCETIIDLMDVNVVWHRRPQHPRLPIQTPLLDRKFVQRENRIHMKSLWQSLGESAKWVNPFSSYEKSNSKILQLRTAARIGFSIPETLVTNDKEEILDFLKKNTYCGTVYKTFSPAIWDEQNKIFSCYTTLITSEMFSDENKIDITLTPGIFQKIIKKKHEVRITFFRNEYVAIKIHNFKELDWRSIHSPSDLKLSQITVPMDVEKKCILLMKHLGIVFGCFDFIVTPEDEYIFLEVNEMGQFLWIEERLPHVKMLDMFCEFLTSN